MKKASATKKKNRKGSENVTMVIILIVCFFVGLVGGYAIHHDDFTISDIFTAEMWVDIYETTTGPIKNFFSFNSDKKDADGVITEDGELMEEISFEGVRLSDVANLEMLKYIDFTVPYNWTFGKVDVENPSIEEAIAVTSGDAVLTVSLRNIDMASDKESILWAEEAMLFELKEKYPDYLFIKPEMFEDEAAIIEGSTDERNAKLYIAIIPLEDKSVYVNYTFKADDWLADLYFNAVIGEMLDSK